MTNSERELEKLVKKHVHKDLISFGDAPPIPGIRKKKQQLVSFDDLDEKEIKELEETEKEEDDRQSNSR